MKVLQVFLFGFLLIYSIANGQVKNISFPAESRVKTLMDNEMKSSDLPAVVAMAINNKGQKVTYTYGKAVWTESSAVTADHIFQIASMTKLLTSIAAMQLVEQGLISLDDELSPLLPEMAKIPILSNGQLRKANNAITLRHLLTHTSGFGFTFTDKELSTFDTKGWEYKDLPRRFESGTQFLYGTSTEWVGRLVEKLSGMSLEAYFRQHITGPLGMNRTWYNVPDSLKPFIVSIGARGEDGKESLKELPERIPADTVTEYNGGGGLYSSPNDFTKLLQCLLNDGALDNKRILKKKTILDMGKNQIGNIPLADAGKYFIPGLCCNFEGMISASSKWGLAWLIDNEDRPYGRKAGTVLWGGILNTYFYIDYKSGVAASIYTQHLPFNHPETTRLLEKFSQVIYSLKNP
jgi:CubicO group peptidase (beta-lactamase class C family)